MNFTGEPFVSNGEIYTPTEDGFLVESATGGQFRKTSIDPRN